MIERDTATQPALNSSMKITKQLTIFEQARLTTPRRSLPQYWCTACAKLSSMVTLDKAREILVLQSPSNDRMNRSMIRALSKGHEMKISTGETLYCVNSLSTKTFNWLIPILITIIDRH
jgi:hypothetical protein